MSVLHSVVKKHTIVRAGGHDIAISPTPTAMVWEKPGAPHERVAVPGLVLGHGEALVEVELATVCGSDVHTALGHRAAPAPLVLGHEQVGRVVVTGDDARRADGTPLAVGDRVVWSVTVSCGGCDRCRTGLPQKCRVLVKYGHERMARGWELNGGFATHVHLRAGTAIVPVAEGVPAAVLAPAGCGTATAVAALEAVAATVPLGGANLLVTGGGLIGLTLCALASDAGARVILADPDPTRRALALRFGAARAVEPTATAVAAALSPAQRVDGPSAVIEASGAGSAVGLALTAAAVGGVVVLVGSVFPGNDVPLSAESIVRRQLTIRGIHNYRAEHLIEAVDFLQRTSGDFPFEQLVGVVLPLDDLDAAIKVAASGAHVRVGVAG
ncbi:hypothetical protein ASD65_08275 [Microbacterium sp. Root61]|uniref:zinc-binding dehydrogenase n=1 Tax=Microbacterium sp. Root61 TaxID=1736570 RepID=UPI0006F27466|nr:alcohol dehydrogenase catalytic domain-containing protein [Microbacterium sp. Root61]KRA24418.1 hypothetical protein ASD65_08275 [Microbacterium sp. Root61]